VKTAQFRQAWKLGLKRILPLLVAALPLLIGSVLAQQAPPSDPPNTAFKVSEANQECLNCHDPEAEGGPAVHMASLAGSPHAEMDCTDCHSSFTAEAPHSEAMLAEKVDCSGCHSDAAEAFAESVHAPTKENAADVPTCTSCHAKAGDPHALSNPGKLARKDQVSMCSSCHNDHERMEKHGVDAEAVSSYEASFHGKALLRFNKQDTAICSDCHGSHNVLASTMPDSTVHKNNVAKTCGQSGCHPGATTNFANSGFSHLHLRVKEEPILSGTELFFKILTFTVLLFLLLGIAFDIRVAFFGPKRGQVSPIVATFVTLGFGSLIASIVLAILNNPAGFQTTIAAVGFGAIAAVAHVLTKHKHPREKRTSRMYQRFTVSQRIQHAVLALSFTALVVTGMPIRYPKNDILRGMYLAMGGIEVMRAAHRVAAVVLIVAWIYHTAELIWRWKKAGFTFESWTMWPRMRDVRDLVETFKYHLGIRKDEPRYDRFQFREKFDYFAVYWGMPIMVFSGLILWYPVQWGAVLPELGIPLAYIAHADEAVLAFLTIVTWHFYNTHFNPMHFPMNPVFVTGQLSEEEMAHHHADELARIKAQEAQMAAVDPQIEPAIEPEEVQQEPEDGAEPDEPKG
jgi:predicted CXXCH cytochrome family protein